ncbi:hypothetical protein Efla_002635 [Eimeria flavescens]
MAYRRRWGMASRLLSLVLCIVLLFSLSAAAQTPGRQAEGRGLLQQQRSVFRHELLAGENHSAPQGLSVWPDASASPSFLPRAAGAAAATPPQPAGAANRPLSAAAAAAAAAAASRFSSSFLETSATAAKDVARHAARLSLRLAQRIPQGPQAPRAALPAARGEAAARVHPAGGAPEALPSKAKGEGGGGAAAAAAKEPLLKGTGGLTGSRRAGLARLTEMYKADAAAEAAKKQQHVQPSTPAGAAAAPKRLTPTKPLTELLAARGIGAKPGGSLPSRRRPGMEKEEGAREKEKTEEEVKRHEEAERRKKEDAEKKKKEEEAQVKKKTTEEEGKKREEEGKKREEEERKARLEEARNRREEERKKKKAEEERLKKEAEEERKKKEAEFKKPPQEEDRQRRKLRELEAMKKEDKEALMKEANEIFAKIDKEAQESQKEFKEPEMRDFVRRVYVNEAGAAEEAKASIDPKIPKKDIDYILNGMKRNAEHYAKEFEYFPGDSLKIISGKYDDPKTGCHTAASNWSRCSTDCGQGKRLRFSVRREGNTCMYTANTQICVSSEKCKSAAQFFNLVGRVTGVPVSEQEEHGRGMSHTLKIRDISKTVCLEYDTGFTERAYTNKGVMGAYGVGRRLRFIQKYDANTMKQFEESKFSRFYPFVC